MFRFLTAGESHGPALTAIIEGVPAGLTVTADPINAQLKRRQGGYGRGARQKIESDTVEILSGVRFGRALGSPITLVVRNRDWANWTTKMSVEPLPEGQAETGRDHRPAPRPCRLRRHDEVRPRRPAQRPGARRPPATRRPWSRSAPSPACCWPSSASPSPPTSSTSAASKSTPTTLICAASPNWPKTAPSASPTKTPKPRSSRPSTKPSTAATRWAARSRSSPSASPSASAPTSTGTSALTASWPRR